MNTAGARVVILAIASPALAQNDTSGASGAADLNRSVAPCDDFYEFANGAWRAANPIPAAMPRWSRRWDQGAQFDAQGRLRNWWAPHDLTRFRDCAAPASSSSSTGISWSRGFTTTASSSWVKASGISRGRGLRTAHSAPRGLAGPLAPTIDGFTPDQQFFISLGEFRGDANPPRIRAHDGAERSASDREVPGGRAALEPPGIPEGVLVPGRRADGAAAGRAMSRLVDGLPGLPGFARVARVGSRAGAVACSAWNLASSAECVRGGRDQSRPHDSRLFYNASRIADAPIHRGRATHARLRRDIRDHRPAAVLDRAPARRCPRRADRDPVLRRLPLRPAPGAQRVERTIYPCVPGHEIVGRVVAVGSGGEEVQGGRPRRGRLHGRLVPHLRQLPGGTRAVLRALPRSPTTAPTSTAAASPTAATPSASSSTKRSCCASPTS